MSGDLPTEARNALRALLKARSQEEALKANPNLLEDKKIKARVDEAKDKLKAALKTGKTEAIKLSQIKDPKTGKDLFLRLIKKKKPTNMLEHVEDGVEDLDADKVYKLFEDRKGRFERADPNKKPKAKRVTNASKARELAQKKISPVRRIRDPDLDPEPEAPRERSRSRSRSGSPVLQGSAKKVRRGGIRAASSYGEEEVANELKTHVCLADALVACIVEKSIKVTEKLEVTPSKPKSGEYDTAAAPELVTVVQCYLDDIQARKKLGSELTQQRKLIKETKKKAELDLKEFMKRPDTSKKITVPLLNEDGKSSAGSIRMSYVPDEPEIPVIKTKAVLQIIVRAAVEAMFRDYPHLVPSLTESKTRASVAKLFGQDERAINFRKELAIAVQKQVALYLQEHITHKDKLVVRNLEEEESGSETDEPMDERLLPKHARSSAMDRMGQKAREMKQRLEEKKRQVLAARGKA